MPKPEDRAPIEFVTDVAPLPPTPEFLAASEAYGIAFEDGEIGRLGTFLSLLLAANDRCNLTAITDPAQAWMKHIFDSLTLIPLLSEIEPDGGAVADVGSGGGVPAIPLAICLPSLRFTMLESTAKKAKFLGSAIAALGLANARVLNLRAEEAGQDHREHREQYDAVTARALGRIAVAAELTLPLAKIGVGRVLLVKGERAEEELKEAKPCLHLLHGTHAGTVETPTGKIVVLTHGRATPRDYPRRDGEPKRKPLGVVA